MTLIKPRAQHKVTVLLITLITLVSTNAVSQERKVLGRIVDDETKKPLKNVNVAIPETSGSAVSNVLGFFEITLDSSKNRTLVCTHIGYGTLTLPMPSESKFQIAMTKVYTVLDTLFLSDYPKNPTSPDPLPSTPTIQSTVAESRASFPGGQGIFVNYLGNQLVADSALLEKFETAVTFTIDESGKAISIRFADSTAGFNSSVTAALNKMQAWTPATQRGSAVQERFVLRILRTHLIFTIVEVSATFPGGMGKFYQAMAREMKYPAAARRAGKQGKVFVQIVVEKDGSVLPENVTVVVPLHSELDDEAVRTVRSIKTKWIPGSQRGKPVRQRMVFPVIFKLG